tara:strand:+ start:583 stop:921 length:339 start_codon:yes stop_codon:yes gene_type:complete
MNLYKIYFATNKDYNNNNDLIKDLIILFKDYNFNYSIIETNGKFTEWRNKENKKVSKSEKGQYITDIEKSYILEYVSNNNFDDDLIKFISDKIKNYYNQSEVLTTKQNINIL